MIIVDTNVLTEPLKLEPEAKVLRWLDNQVIGSLYLTSTIVSEAFFGIERLPHGRRKNSFRLDLEQLLDQYFSNNVLAFDEIAARKFALIVAEAERHGKNIQVSDGQIAAVALTTGFSIATRDTAPFEAAGINVINPWLVN